MKKYKLLKKYPGSLPPNEKIETKEDGSYTDMLGMSFWPHTYPEYWEEIIEKEYSILKMRLHQHCTSNLEEDGLYHTVKNDCIGKTFEELSSKGYNIHSVKRLFDGEIFTVGDLCYVDSTIFMKSKIDSIGFCDKDLRLKGSSYHAIISVLFKCKKPLFTTKDGIEMFEGDEYFYVVIHDRAVIHNAWEPLSHEVDWSTPFKPPLGFVQFSTKEKAKAYINSHKPIFSWNDIFRVFPSIVINDNIKYLKLKSIIK